MTPATKGKDRREEALSAVGVRGTYKGTKAKKNVAYYSGNQDQHSAGAETP
jgi:hypothetical protein